MTESKTIYQKINSLLLLKESKCAIIYIVKLGKGDNMKKYLYVVICLLSFCFINNVKAVMIVPQFDVQVSNEAGAQVKNGDNVVATIPYNTELKLLNKQYDKGFSYVMYEGNEVTINNADIKVVNATFEKENGFELGNPEHFKVLADSGLEMYSGPSDIFYSKVEGVVIPKDTEVEYKYIDEASNTDEMFVYVTYNGMNGWVHININTENVALKKPGVIMILDSNNIRVKQDVNGAYEKINVDKYTVISYEYLTKYKYYITYNGKNLWLSITDMNSIAYTSSNSTLTVNSGDVIYETHNGGNTLYTFDSEESVEPLFYYNDYYYIEYGDYRGWVNIPNIIENNTMSRLQPIELTETPTQKETKEEKPKTSTFKKIEAIVVFGLAIILLLSVTSLIALMIMNKSGDKKLDNTIKEELLESDEETSNNE